MNAAISRRFAPRLLLSTSLPSRLGIRQPLRFLLNTPRAALQPSFSPKTQTRLYSSTTEGQKNEQKSSSSPGNPKLAAVTWESLGVSRNMRIVVVALVGIFATMETWFYCKLAWRWWKGDTSEGEDEAD